MWIAAHWTDLLRSWRGRRCNAKSASSSSQPSLPRKKLAARGSRYASIGNKEMKGSPMALRSARTRIDKIIGARIEPRAQAQPGPVIGRISVRTVVEASEFAPCCKTSTCLTRFPGGAFRAMRWIETKPAGSAMPCAVSWRGKAPPSRKPWAFVLVVAACRGGRNSSSDGEMPPWLNLPGAISRTDPRRRRRKPSM